MERFDYFSNIESRYKSKISQNKAVVIRADGLNLCSNRNIDLLDDSIGTVAYAMKKTAEILSEEYSCYAFVASDEINLIFKSPNLLINLYESCDTQRLSTLISQKIYQYVANYCDYKNKDIYFDARCFSIPTEKVKSYILYRRNLSINLLTNYYAKQNLPDINRRGVSLPQLTKKIEERNSDFQKRSTFQKEGIIYYCGIEYEVDRLMKIMNKSEEKYSLEIEDEGI